jgi:T-complex protein 1 subunit gamma
VHNIAGIVKHKPDVFITEKGQRDLATHFLTKAGINSIRRLCKTNINRIARVGPQSRRYVL